MEIHELKIPWETLPYDEIKERQQLLSSYYESLKELSREIIKKMDWIEEEFDKSTEETKKRHNNGI
jgi:hypothetical protein